MAEVQQNSGGDGAKNKQKKQNLRVDFTPMVDMNMLLITFFMLCTTLLKPQSMNLNMPTKDDKEKEIDDGTKVAESSAITFLLGADDELYYYEGMPEEASYEDPEFLKVSSYGAEGIRAYLINRNRRAYEQIQVLKQKKTDLEITEQQYRDEVKKIQEEVAKADKTTPQVMIKPTDLATYMNMVQALDEMAICNIGAYAILDVADGDRRLLYEKTKNIDYLSDAEKAELAGE